VEPDSYVFGSFQLVPGQRVLLDDGRAISIGSRALDILTILVESPGETISNARIMARGWPRTTVDDGSLRVQIGALRRALGDDRAGNRFIANIPGQGYRFVAPVKRGEARSRQRLRKTGALRTTFRHHLPALSAVPVQSPDWRHSCPSIGC
jgi:DNA-binding winged helix-turn-helix (wHTH) protein